MRGKDRYDSRGRRREKERISNGRELGMFIILQSRDRDMFYKEVVWLLALNNMNLNLTIFNYIATIFYV